MSEASTASLLATAMLEAEMVTEVWAGCTVACTLSVSGT